MERVIKRLRISIQGAVQGVGFRPFVYRLALELALKGWVNNSSQGLVIEVEGPSSALDAFLKRVSQEKPPLSFIQSLQSVFLDTEGFKNFEIRESDSSEDKTVFVLPDIATCPDCTKEIFDKENRRYLYPFTNCTHCGPRYSIIESLPYDRGNTSMKNFAMCAACQEEYENPSDRRFHAQPNACPECGPHVELWDKDGNILGEQQEALLKTIAAVQSGAIVAIKGLGGFHLFADAQNQESVRLLRERKHREEKPLALMFPTERSVELFCDVSNTEKRLLASPEAPIVLLRKRLVQAAMALAPDVAPGNPYLGALLPYTPLHHILMRKRQRPIIATSGNISEEPLCIDEKEALSRLAGIADFFLVHNRPIVRHVDDSIVKIMNDRPLVLRRARGYAPLPVSVKGGGPSVIAVGAHLKNSVALKIKDNVFVSQHIGDLQTDQSFSAFKETLKSLQGLYTPDVKFYASDMHPEYLSTKFAAERKKTGVKVQHHHAHIVSCMAENHLEGEVLGIAWDGTGYGLDGTVWGGEFLLSTLTDFKRAGHFKPFALPGGEQAVKEPRRAAVGALWMIFKENMFDLKELPPLKAFSSQELRVMTSMIDQQMNSPMTSSVGRLFDVVASFLNLSQKVCFEGQAAMALEFLIQRPPTKEKYPFVIHKKNPLIVDWELMLKKIIEDIRGNIDFSEISAKFHNTLIEMAVEVVKIVNQKRVVLSGGCFQNTYLAEGLVRRLEEEGFHPYWHQLVPPNDGGISLGQAVAAASRLEKNP